MRSSGGGVGWSVVSVRVACGDRRGRFDERHEPSEVRGKGTGNGREDDGFVDSLKRESCRWLHSVCLPTWSPESERFRGGDVLIAVGTILEGR